MSTATQAALLLLGAGWLQSFVYICSKVPPERLPPGYPKSGSSLALLNLTWIVMFGAGLILTLGISPWLALLGGILYFAVLPFVFQLPLVKLFGFRNYREFIDLVDELAARKKQGGKS